MLHPTDYQYSMSFTSLICIRAFPPSIPPLRGRHPHFLLEYPGKKSRVTVADRIADFRNALSRLEQQEFAVGDSDVADKFRGRLAGEGFGFKIGITSFGPNLRNACMVNQAVERGANLYRNLHHPKIAMPMAQHCYSILQVTNWDCRHTTYLPQISIFTSMLLTQHQKATEAA